MPTDLVSKLIRKDFFWDVHVIQASSAGENNSVMFTLTLNTIDDYGQENKIMVEMCRHELDRCIAELKKKV